METTKGGILEGNIGALVDAGKGLFRKLTVGH
jgi:hypothetical protein